MIDKEKIIAEALKDIRFKTLEIERIFQYIDKIRNAYNNNNNNTNPTSGNTTLK